MPTHSAPRSATSAVTVSFSSTPLCAARFSHAPALRRASPVLLSPIHRSSRSPSRGVASSFEIHSERSPSVAFTARPCSPSHAHSAPLMPSHCTGAPASRATAMSWIALPRASSNGSSAAASPSNTKILPSPVPAVTAGRPPAPCGTSRSARISSPSGDCHSDHRGHSMRASSAPDAIHSAPSLADKTPSIRRCRIGGPPAIRFTAGSTARTSPESVAIHRTSAPFAMPAVASANAARSAPGSAARWNSRHAPPPSRQLTPLSSRAAHSHAPSRRRTRAIDPIGASRTSGTAAGRRSAPIRTSPASVPTHSVARSSSKYSPRVACSGGVGPVITTASALPGARCASPHGPPTHNPASGPVAISSVTYTLSPGSPSCASIVPRRCSDSASKIATPPWVATYTASRSPPCPRA